ncbi:MAG TPA: hypothetical protein VEK57_25055 [Thermoanaerobaculia bacterium]|nr:hypothetical protein [Thermoanaerobaculia bacterium]
MRKLLANEELTLTQREQLLVELLRERTSETASRNRDRLHLDTPEEISVEATARQFHETYLPRRELDLATSTLASPENLRTALADKTTEIGELRSQIRTFHRGIERLQRSGWNAEKALAHVAMTASSPKTASTSSGQRRRRPTDVYPAGWTPPKPLPPEVMKLLPTEQSVSWQRYAHRVLEGQDTGTSLAYVDFLYAASLSGAGKFSQLAKLDVLRPSLTITPEAASLRKLTRALISDARVRTAKSVLQLWPQVAERISSSSAHRLAAALPADTVAVAVTRSAKEVAELDAMPEWERATKLKGPLEGFTSSTRTMDLYMRTADTLQLLRVDRQSGKAKLLVGTEAAKSFQAHCRAQIRKYSHPGFRLANVLRAKGGYRILMADRSVRLTMSEAARLALGQRLPPDHALSRILIEDPSFVVYSHPLMAREGRYRADADQIAFDVQRSYPEVRVFKDDLSDRTAGRAETVSQFLIGNPEDVVILKADDSFHVDDANILKDITDDLKSSGIQVEEITPHAAVAAVGRSRLVIVLSGHIDAKLAEFVRQAGEAGYFRNNIVAFNSCASALTSQLVHEMNTRYGAVATWRYDGKIPAAKVQEILLKLHDEIDQKPTLDDWKRYVHEEGLSGVWNICLLRDVEKRKEAAIG